MEDITDGLARRLAIEDAEDLQVVTLQDFEGVEVIRYWLVGSVLTTKDFNKEAFVATIKRIWRVKGGVSITQWDDSNRWSDPMKVPLQSTKFWVRVRGLPSAFQSSEFGERIRGKLGVVHRVIGGQESDSAGRFLRIRVDLNIHRPLHRWVLFQPDPTVEASKYPLEYENLPYFCLYCGRLSHVCSGCDLHKSGKLVEKQYGRWKTLIKDVFCIDPDGELKGKSFGLTSKNKGWVMKAPVVFLSGSVRNREEAFPGDAPNGNEMEVAVLAGEEVEPVVPTEKRQVFRGAQFGRAPCQDPQSGGLSVSIPSSALMVGETSGRKSIKEFELSRPLSSIGPLSIVGPAKGTDEASIKLNPMALNKVKPTMGFDYILKGLRGLKLLFLQDGPLVFLL
ncbi:hypothetical protein M0R45_006114 [Rubus argutus]|uniref:DUF4283 domain-containing protein n=1 Tax=Rubus argutus TaxID=59490 RepID=A0AAW1YPH5_RUBAR